MDKEFLSKIPENIKNDHGFRCFTIFKIGVKDVEFQATRKPTDKDIPVVLNDSGMVLRRGMYYGEWEDTTEVAQEQSVKYRRASAIQTIERLKDKEDRSGVEQFSLQSAQRELARAERLLAELRGEK